MLPRHGGRPRVRRPTPLVVDGAIVSVHVLLIEDEAAIRKVVRRLLEAVGHRVTAVGGTREALAWLAEPRDVAVVLLDRSMPDGLGETIIPELRRRLPAARVLLFTGQDVEPEVAAMADGVLAKPMTSEDLLKAVDAATARR
jgi:DNA-binding NtrC family response regulator